MRRDREGLLVHRLGALHERRHFAGDPAVHPDVLVEERDDAPDLRVLVGRGRVVAEGAHLDERAEVLLPRGVARDARAADALDEHLGGAIRIARDLEDAPDDPDAEEVLRPRLVHVGALLGDEEDPAVLGERRLDRRERGRPPDEQRDDHVREDDDIPERHDGDALGDVEAFGFAGEGEGHGGEYRGETGFRVEGSGGKGRGRPAGAPNPSLNPER